MEVSAGEYGGFSIPGFRWKVSLNNELVGWPGTCEIPSHYKNQDTTSILACCVAASSVLDMSMAILSQVWQESRVESENH